MDATTSLSEISSTTELRASAGLVCPSSGIAVHVNLGHGRRKRSSSGSMVLAPLATTARELHNHRHTTTSTTTSPSSSTGSPTSPSTTITTKSKVAAVAAVLAAETSTTTIKAAMLKHSFSQSSIVENSKHHKPARPTQKNLAELPSIATSLVPVYATQPQHAVTTKPKGMMPSMVQIRPSLCGEFTVVAEVYKVPLMDCTGHIPMDRRCVTAVYGHAMKARGAVLLIPGFASNRAVFDMGGGKGRDGPSFFEYLAKRGYDTYSIDLRGSRNALSLGSKPPAFLKEHVEVDVPSAIKFIKCIGPYEKVYLIGHSMGGAISCAVAGHVPDEVAGIVHLAGLYHYTIPYMHDFLDFYRARCPPSVRNVIRTGAGMAIRSAVSILSPAISSLLHFLSPPSTLAIDSPASTAISTPNPDPMSDLQLATPPKPSLFVELRRKPIPLRSAVDFCLFLKKFIPAPVERLLMNCMYPSPWLPYSVDDPWALVDLSAESPTIGIWLAINKMAVQDEIYNAWVMQSSTHRAEVQKIEDSKNDSSIAKMDEELESPLSLSSSLPSISGATTTLAEITSSAVSATGNAKLKHALNPMLKPLSGPDEKRPRKHSPPSSAATPKSVENNISWNELSPYLERFEQLEHLPLFFCHANADAILRKEDTMAGYRRSGSKWKEVIEYVEEVAKKPVRAATLPVSLSIEPVKSKVDDGTSHLSVLDDAGSDGSQSSTASPDPIRSRKPGKRRLAASIKLTPLKDDSGIDLDKPVLASPVATTPVTVEPPVMEPPKRKEGLKSRYSVPETFKYGHCDILGGRHAEQVWERIVDWLDATTAREREWRFKRRYSAK